MFQEMKNLYCLLVMCSKNIVVEYRKTQQKNSQLLAF